MTSVRENSCLIRLESGLDSVLISKPASLVRLLVLDGEKSTTGIKISEISVSK